MKKLFLYFFVLTLALYPTLSFAGPKKDNDDNPRLKDFKKELNLTNQQKDDLSKIRSEQQKKIIDLNAELQKVRIDLKNEIKNINLNEDKILSLTAKTSELQAKIKETRTTMWLKSYKLLDDKQKEIWKKSTPLLAEGKENFKRKAKEFRGHFRDNSCK